MTNVGYIDCLVNLYLRSKEYEVRWDLGEDLMMVNFDMSDSVYYEEGVNSVCVTLSFSKKYVYTIVGGRNEGCCNWFERAAGGRSGKISS